MNAVTKCIAVLLTIIWCATTSGRILSSGNDANQIKDAGGQTKHLQDKDIHHSYKGETSSVEAKEGYSIIPHIKMAVNSKPSLHKIPKKKRKINGKKTSWKGKRKIKNVGKRVKKLKNRRHIKYLPTHSFKRKRYRKNISIKPNKGPSKVGRFIRFQNRQNNGLNYFINHDDNSNSFYNTVRRLQPSDKNPPMSKTRENVNQFLVPITLITSEGLSTLPLNPDIRVTIRVMGKKGFVSGKSITKTENETENKFPFHIPPIRNSSNFSLFNSSIFRSKSRHKAFGTTKGKSKTNWNRHRNHLKQSFRPYRHHHNQSFRPYRHHHNRQINKNDKEHYESNNYFYYYDYDDKGGSVLPTSGSFDFESDFHLELDPKLYDMNLYLDTKTTPTTVKDESFLSSILNFFSDKKIKNESKGKKNSTSSPISPKSPGGYLEDIKTTVNITTSKTSLTERNSLYIQRQNKARIPVIPIRNNTLSTTAGKNRIYGRFDDEKNVSFLDNSFNFLKSTSTTAIPKTEAPNSSSAGIENSSNGVLKESSNSKTHKDIPVKNYFPVFEELKKNKAKGKHQNKNSSKFKKFSSPKDLVEDLIKELEKLSEKAEKANISLKGLDTCEKWKMSGVEDLLQKKALVELLPICPCHYPDDLIYNDNIWDQASNSSFRWRPVNNERELMGVLYQGAYLCIRSVAFEHGPSLASQTCCYDGNRRLLTRGSGAGFPAMVSPEISPSLHYLLDVNPWKACSGNFLRLNEFRHPNVGVDCTTNPEDDVFSLQVQEATDY